MEHLWSDDDERKLTELTNRKKQIQKVYFEGVVKIAGTMHAYNMSADDLADQLIDNAADVIKALTPYANRVVPG